MKVGEKWKKSNNKPLYWKARTFYGSFSYPVEVIILEFNDVHVLFEDRLRIFGVGKKALPKSEFLENYERIYDEYQ